MKVQIRNAFCHILDQPLLAVQEITLISNVDNRQILNSGVRVMRSFKYLLCWIAKVNCVIGVVSCAARAT